MARLAPALVLRDPPVLEEAARVALAVLALPAVRRREEQALLPQLEPIPTVFALRPRIFNMESHCLEAPAADRAVPQAAKLQPVQVVVEAAEAAEAVEISLRFLQTLSTAAVPQLWVPFALMEAMAVLAALLLPVPVFMEEVAVAEAVVEDGFILCMEL